MSLSGKGRVAGVMGWPVSHSRSPRLHGWWLEQYGIDGAYVPLPVRPEDFEAAVRTLPKLGFAGANVTVPHKEAALRACDTVSDLARRVGAVNTLVCRADGSLHGDNTDGFGFLENLRAGCPEWQSDAAPAVVLGAGGAARAVVAVLQDAGCPEIRLTNRTRARAEELAADLGGTVTVVDWEARSEALDGAGLLANTTTLGMEGAPPLELALDALPVDALVTDIVYAPLVTEVLSRAWKRGNPIVDGLGMLLHQGRPGFEAWFGVFPDVTDALRRHVLSDGAA
jgi:shikimate dehydrogenase